MTGEVASRRSVRGSRRADWQGLTSHGLRRISVVLLAVTAGLCPLLAGSVHRPALIAILTASFLAFASAFLGERLRGRGLRGRQFSIFFLLLVLIPIVQVIPLPSSLRGVIDPGGLALLENAPHGTPRFWPLSLDPVSTRQEIGTAAATLVVFMLALHNAMSRRRRMLVLNAVAFAGVLAIISGFAHRIFGIDHLYGLFRVFGSMLPGPFINPNHAAEFYELTAFVALALALEADAEARIGWYVVAGLSAAVALTTLSRGAFLGLLAGGGTFVFFRSHSQTNDGGSASKGGTAVVRKTLAWSLFAACCLATIAFVLGASPVLDELAHTNLTNGTEKVVVWKDSLPLVLRHPWGIGRHAFDRVYPVYKTLPLNNRFEFVENGPMQLLVDLGWLAFALLGLALVWIIRKLSWRRDDVGAALVAALIAVVAHNLVDFGLETAGIRLSFAAVAGVAIGRIYGRKGGDQPGGDGRVPIARGVATISAIVIPVGLLIGIAAQLGTTAEDVERRWKQASTTESRRAIAIEGGEMFPTDYFFPLLQSYDEPLRAGSPNGRSSPKLATLNRAMRLCPTCSVVHEQAARVLQRLGLRGQALSSFRDTVRLAPNRLRDLLPELERYRYRPVEIATLAVGRGPEIETVAKFLIPKGAVAQTAVLDLIAQAEAQGAPREDLLLLRADLEVALGRLDEAEIVLDQARKLVPRDGRSYAALSVVAEKQGRLEVALEQARRATTLSPMNVAFSRHRLALVTHLKKWDEIDAALEHLKIALRQGGENITEVHMLAGQMHQTRGNLARALSEFRTATLLDGSNTAPWAALARVSEERGDLSGALEAQRRIVTIRPDDKAARQAIERLEKERNDSELRRLLP